MTLQESTGRLLAAIEAEDFTALAKALEARAAAIAQFRASRPSPASIAMGQDSLRAGQTACLLLQALKQRIASESRRLAQIQEGFVESLRHSHQSRVDYRG